MPFNNSHKYYCVPNGGWPGSIDRLALNCLKGPFNICFGDKDAVRKPIRLHTFLYGPKINVILIIKETIIRDI